MTSHQPDVLRAGVIPRQYLAWELLVIYSDRRGKSA